MQWLRYTRPHHPTLEELMADEARQNMLRGLVHKAEQKWKAMPLKEQAPAKESAQSKPVLDPKPTKADQEDPRVAEAQIPKAARRG